MVCWGQGGLWGLRTGFAGTQARLRAALPPALLSMASQTRASAAGPGLALLWPAEVGFLAHLGLGAGVEGTCFLGKQRRAGLPCKFSFKC